MKKQIAAVILLFIVGKIACKKVPQYEVSNRFVIFGLRKIMDILNWIGYGFLGWHSWIIDRFGRRESDNGTHSISL